MKFYDGFFAGVKAGLGLGSGLTSQREPRTHDYSVRYWGHDYVFRPIDGGLRARMTGWGTGIRKGDYLIIQGVERGETTRYQVVWIEYLWDPRDMWRAEVNFAPRDSS